MYKWHVHSAIGHGRPLAGDFSKVADGIAASLRLFHVSASKGAEGAGNDGAPIISRAQRSAVAAAEISSLIPGPVDARSLAAKPPPTFRIRRLEDSMGKYDALGETKRVSTQRPRFSNRMIGPADGFRRQGNGADLRGRGRGRGRGKRGGGRGRGKRRSMAMRNDEGMVLGEHKYSEKEQAYLDMIAMGVPRPAPVGITERETLLRDVPAVATSTAPIGLVATIRDRMRALAGEHGNEYLTSEEHARHYLRGTGTLFIDNADKAKAIGPDRYMGAPKDYQTLDEAERQAIVETLVVGKYQPIKPAANGDTLGVLEAYAQRNESYLPKHKAALKARVESLLPAKSAATVA